MISNPLDCNAWAISERERGPWSKIFGKVQRISSISWSSIPSEFLLFWNHHKVLDAQSFVIHPASSDATTWSVPRCVRVLTSCPLLKAFSISSWLQPQRLAIARFICLKSWACIQSICLTTSTGFLKGCSHKSWWEILCWAMFIDEA